MDRCDRDAPVILPRTMMTWARSAALLCVLLSSSMLSSGCAVGDPPIGPMGGPDAHTPRSQDAGVRAQDTGPSRADAASMADGGAQVQDAGPAPRGCQPQERCDDGVDNNCDGVVDEDCVCEPGRVSACFLGLPETRLQGICADGQMVCLEDFEFGHWGPCLDSILPAEELCDAAGLDEDCDGAPNEGCDCAEGDADLECGSDMGECVAGGQRCVEGVRTDCEGSVGPAAEVCDGLDNDCDGEIDEHLTQTCGSDVGACRMGISHCVEGAFGACEGGSQSATESCDGLDNDCDGEIDESVSRLCGTDVGRCVAGVERCEAGLFGECRDRISPIAETCNGVDDDCDGEVDEDLTQACGSDQGQCHSGLQSCSGGRFGPCMGEVTPTVERCDGSHDEDCDGTTDENCQCTEGARRPCGVNEGICRQGTQRCDLEGQWGQCEGAINPVAERCNRLDDNCDGRVDEGCECAAGDRRECGTSVGLCTLGAETCDEAGVFGPCQGATVATAELCNNLDDDCDGAIDEDDVCPRFPPILSCPADQDTLVGETVSLPGMGSDPDGGEVQFRWTVVLSPTGSRATPSARDSDTTTFTPDVPGDYTLQLCVQDDEGESRCCISLIEARSACEPPETPVLSACGISWDRRPLVEFPALPAGLRYELYSDLDPAPYALVTLEGQNYHRPSAALGEGAPLPGQSVELQLRACRLDDLSCCSASTSAQVTLVEACDTPIEPTAENIVFSEYVDNGDGACPGPDCEAGEAIEITNLSHCPVRLEGHHFGYCNPNSCSAFRWMDFGEGDIIPPRGVYVAIRNREASSCEYPFLGPNDPAMFGLRISTLDMQGQSLESGWFKNGGGGMSILRIATGPWSTIDGGSNVELVAPYLGAPECSSVGFDALDACGNISAAVNPSDVLTPNQLGRLWHPCDAVTSPLPADCR